MSAKVRSPRALGLPKAQQSGRSHLAQLAIFAKHQTRPRSPSPPSERLNRRCTLKRCSAAPPEPALRARSGGYAPRRGGFAPLRSSMYAPRRTRISHLAIFADHQTRPRSPSPPSERLNRRCTLKRRSAAPPERRSAPSRGATLRAAGASPPSVPRAQPPSLFLSRCVSPLELTPRSVGHLNAAGAVPSSPPPRRPESIIHFAPRPAPPPPYR